MKKFEVLNQVETKALDPKKAYAMLYPKFKQKKPRRAHFIKVTVRVPEEKGVNILLGVLLALPIPIFIIRLVLRKRMSEHMMKDIPLSTKELIDLISIRGSRVNVIASDQTRVSIRTI